MFEIRTITTDDAALFRSRLARGFGRDADDDEAAVARFDAIFELDRTFGVFDGSDMIGTGGGFSLGVTVPGGAEVPMAGTTVITVQPTHRRRGVLRQFMERHLDDVANREEPLAGLWASEGSIYGRFGYGPATFRHSAEVDLTGVSFAAEAPKGSIRLVEPAAAEDIVRSLYERARPGRAGMLTRSDAWWAHRIFADPETWREGKSALRYLVFEEDQTPTGYATYRQKSNWDDFISSGEIGVEEVMATTDVAHSGLWGVLANIDLFTKLDWWNMPVDDPLPWKITDQRRVRRKLVDGLWIRVMDVPSALGKRSYDDDGVVTFHVTDSTRPEVSGTYRLETENGIGNCERVTANPDVSFPLDVLGHLYLGGGDAFAMAAAGRIEGDAEAVGRLQRLMRTARPPWCPEVF